MTAPSTPDLTILIPAYNEEAVITDTIEAIIGFFRRQPYRFEVLVVDNNSNDKTANILEQLSHDMPELRWIKSEPRPGYGVAVKSGLDHYHGDAVVIAMADGSETPEDIARLYELVRNGADCGFGTRFAGGDRTSGYPPFKLRLNRLANAFLSTLTGFKYDDFTNGFKAYKRWVIDAIKPLKGEEFELTIEMAMKAIGAGAAINVVENTWRERDDGVSKFKILRQCTRYLTVIPGIMLSSDSPGAAFIRFLCVGLTSSAVYLAMLAIFVELADLSATLGSVLAYLFGTVVSYIGSAKFAFKNKISSANLARFLIVVGMSFVLNFLIAWFLERAGAHYLLIGGVIICIVSIFNFLCHRYWTFRQEPAR